MSGKVFTEQNRSVLHIVFRYGGYIKVDYLNYIMPTISKTSRYRNLAKLTEMGYLTNRRLETNSKSEKVIYQVTAKACKLFNNPDAYFRKKHKAEYINRALTKSRYLCSLHNKYSNNIITGTRNKINTLSKCGYDDTLMPKKINGDKYFTHIEETIINFNSTSFETIPFEDGTQVDNVRPKIILVFIDDEYKDVKKQFTNFSNRYSDMIMDNQSQDFHFLFVCKNNERFLKYQEHINNVREVNKYEPIVIDREIIRLYLQFLKKYNESKFNEIMKELRIKYPKIDKSRIIEFTQDYFTNKLQYKKIGEFSLSHIDIIKSWNCYDGLMTITEKVKNSIIDNRVSNNVKINAINQYFIDVMILNLKGVIDMEHKDKNSMEKFNFHSTFISE